MLEWWTWDVAQITSFKLKHLRSILHYVWSWIFCCIFNPKHILFLKYFNNCFVNYHMLQSYVILKLFIYVILMLFIFFIFIINLFNQFPFRRFHSLGFCRIEAIPLMLWVWIIMTWLVHQTKITDKKQFYMNMKGFYGSTLICQA